MWSGHARSWGRSRSAWGCSPIAWFGVTFGIRVTGKRVHYLALERADSGAFAARARGTMRALSRDMKAQDIAIAVEKDLYGQVISSSLTYGSVPKSAWGRVAAYAACGVDRTCDGSGILYRAHWDSGRDDTYCQGCVLCLEADTERGIALRAARAVGRTIWIAARLDLRNALDMGIWGFAALASIGASIEYALAPGRAIASMLGACVANWQTLIAGRWVRVTGKAGKRARDAHGMIGQITEMRTDSHDRGYFGRAGVNVSRTDTVCVQTTDGARRWIPTSQCSPVVAPVVAESPVETRERARAAALLIPVCPNRVEAIVLVAPSKPGLGSLPVTPGSRVRVFWTGNGRVGVKDLSCAHKGRCACSVAWIGDRALVPVTPGSVEVTTEIRELIAVRLAEVGATEIAERWFAAAK